jgi:hypothetical protein
MTGPGAPPALRRPGAPGRLTEKRARDRLRRNHRRHARAGRTPSMWDPKKRPPLDRCPERYCFHWVTPGGCANISRRAYDSLADSFADHDAWVDFPEGGCACDLGPCIRLSRAAGAKDWYEPHEPALERDGLPWFYFVREQSLTRRARRQFERLARVLWGEDTFAGGTTRQRPAK